MLYGALPLRYRGRNLLTPKNLMGRDTTGSRFCFAVAFVGFELATIGPFVMSSDH